MHATNYAYDKCRPRDEELWAKVDPKELAERIIIPPGTDPTVRELGPIPSTRAAALDLLHFSETSPIAALRYLAATSDARVIECMRQRYRDVEVCYPVNSVEPGIAMDDLTVALLAANDIEDWRATFQTVDYTIGPIDGLVTRTGLSEAFGENPWGLEATSTLEAIIDQVWGPLAERLSNFVRFLHERCLAVALVRDDAGNPSLSYLFLKPHGAFWALAETPNFDDLVSCIGIGEPMIINGSAPDNTSELRDSSGRVFQLPAGLRELRSVHGRLDDTMAFFGASASRLDSYSSLVPGSVPRFQSRNHGALPSQFVIVGGNGGGDYDVFDLDLLDGRGDPQVAYHDHELLDTSERSPFWKHLDTRLCYDYLHVLRWVGAWHNWVGVWG